MEKEKLLITRTSKKYLMKNVRKKWRLLFLKILKFNNCANPEVLKLNLKDILASKNTLFILRFKNSVRLYWSKVTYLFNNRTEVTGRFRLH